MILSQVAIVTDRLQIKYWFLVKGTVWVYYTTYQTYLESLTISYLLILLHHNTPPIPLRTKNIPTPLPYKKNYLIQKFIP